MPRHWNHWPPDWPLIAEPSVTRPDYVYQFLVRADLARLRTGCVMCRSATPIRRAFGRHRPVWLLEPDGDVLRPWTAREIDRLPTSHRLRLADIDGNGAPVVLNAPLTDAQAVPPDYQSRTPLVYYRPGEWQRKLISDQNEGVQ